MDKKKYKQKIREQLLKQRSSIPEGMYIKKSARICERLMGLQDFKEAHTIHCYVSMNNRREVNTHPLIKAIIQSSKQMVVPVSDLSSGTMEHVRLDRFEALKANKWGVLEPAHGEDVAVQELDLVIVPMVGGDLQKNRIGYGKGFYDRFLEKVNCTTIGLLLEECLVEEIPVEKFDVPLDIIITEKRLHN